MYIFYYRYRLLYLTLYFLFKSNSSIWIWNLHQGQNETHSQNALLVLLVQQKQENGQQMFPHVYSPKLHPSLALVISVPMSVVFLIGLKNYISSVKWLINNHICCIYRYLESKLLVDTITRRPKKMATFSILKLCTCSIAELKLDTDHCFYDSYFILAYQYSLFFSCKFKKPKSIW